MRKRQSLAIASLLLLVPAAVSACTGIRIKPQDGSIICARTMEFAVDLESNVIIVPRGHEFQGSAPGGKPGLKWSAKYGHVGANAFGLPLVADGLNEKGLAAGAFYFPGSAGYQKVADGETSRAISPPELVSYLLSTCASVPEAVHAAQSVRVGAVVFPKLGGVPPLHFVLHDSNGRCVVLEHIGGALHVHDNPIGVMSNSPGFDWHLTNLSNYVNLTVTSVPPLVFSSGKLAALGQGSGMLGLPGDFTPPSRFVRAAVFSQAALPVKTAGEGVLQAFHLLNQFDIPKGASRGEGPAKNVAEYTLWTSASDCTNLRYYFHTYESRRIRMVDLKTADFSAKAIKTIPMTGAEVIEDVTTSGK